MKTIKPKNSTKLSKVFCLISITVFLFSIGVSANCYADKAKELDLTSVQEEILQLEQAHLRIWEMEKLLKSGLEDQLPLDEIGRRAIKIRNLNGERIVIKNALSKKLGCEVVEIKKDHLSELQ